MKPKIIFFGTPDFVVPVLEALIKNFQVIGVVTTPDQKVGRKQVLTPSSVKLAFLSCHSERSEEFRDPSAKPQDDKIILTPESLNDEEFIQEIKNLSPDLFVVAAFGKIIPQSILDIPKFGSLNIHPSLLPKYRGPSPIQNTILNGDQVSGVTIIQMDAKMDHGPIVFTSEISLSDKETFDTLSKKMFEIGARILVDIIPDYINGKIQIKPQNDNEATFTKIITKEDGYFDIDNPPSPEQLDRMIRAYYPWPNAWTKWSFDKAQDKNGKIVKFLPSSVIPAKAGIQKAWIPGQARNDKFLVQMEGKNPTKLEDFLRGYPTFPIPVDYLLQY